ncbi:cell division protein FtsZ [Candidatus Woesearchaeota archaeon]|nr:cell division protein FtsZ [Candidatus Woesearchaeota archaeon]
MDGSEVLDLVKPLNIKVVGTGGSGNNIVSWLYQKGIKGAEVIACNTDHQQLNVTKADKKFIIGRNVTRGLGCGGFPEKGVESAKESIAEIRASVKDADMVFVCAGMGGGTGTGSAPVVATAAKDMGAIVIDNNRLVHLAGNLPIQQAFAIANELISTVIKGIVETIALPSLVNLDYADVKAIMQNGGVAAIGVGVSDTGNRVEEAVKGALSNPLLDINYQGATGALIHVTGGPDMTLDEVAQIGELVTESLDEDANVIWGARIADDHKGKISVMTIITGVQSPQLLGKAMPTFAAKKQQAQHAAIELGLVAVA